MLVRAIRIDCLTECGAMVAHLLWEQDVGSSSLSTLKNWDVAQLVERLAVN